MSPECTVGRACSGGARRKPQALASERAPFYLVQLMSALHSLRRSPRPLRIALAALLAAFALNSIAHVTHRHDNASVAQTADSLACGYCVVFDGLVDSPQHTYLARSSILDLGPTASPTGRALPRKRQTLANPRAPPIS